MKKKYSVQKMTYLAVLTAIVILFQLCAVTIKIGLFSVSLVLLPIALGACLLGPGAGAFLGLVFGVAVLISGDAAPFLEFSVFGTIVVVIVKGILAGLGSGLLFRALEKRDFRLSSAVAAVACPVINTGIFFVGCLVFFYDLIVSWSGGQSAFAYVALVIIGVNFLFELGINVLLSPVLYKLLTIKKKRVS